MDLSEFWMDFSESENPSKSIWINFLDTWIDLKFLSADIQIWTVKKTVKVGQMSI